MPKGQESRARKKQSFNKIDLAEIKSSIKKMSDYASSSASSGKDSFCNGQESAIVPKDNRPQPEEMDTSSNDPTSTGQETPKNQVEMKIPSFRKKVQTFRNLKLDMI